MSHTSSLVRCDMPKETKASLKSEVQVLRNEITRLQRLLSKNESAQLREAIGTLVADMAEFLNVVHGETIVRPWDEDCVREAMETIALRSSR